MRRAVLSTLVVALAAAGAGTARADDAAPSAPSADRQDKGAFGVGIVLGEPTGLCAKLYLADDRAIAASIGEGFGANAVEITADYLFHPYILTKRDEFVVPFYVGPGFRAIDYSKSGNDSYAAVGARVVAGILFDFKNNVPIDVFAEAAFVVEYGTKSNGWGVGVNAGAGVRYYF